MKNIIILFVLIVFASCKNVEKEQKISIEKPTKEQLARYVELKNEAWKLYEAEEYLKSAQKYSEAFKITGENSDAGERYNAACSWALANEIDSSYFQLFQATQQGAYSNYSHITTDTDLSNLHTDKRWDKLLEIVKKNKEQKEANLDKPLVAILDTIYQEDQGLRKEIKNVEEQYGRESDEMKAHWKKIAEKDSVNLIKVQTILNERGWLGEDMIGAQGNSTLFLVIQHSPLEIQEKYLPMMREAVLNKNARASSLALLEDRIAMRKGGKQIYGSQIKRNQETGEFYVSPLIDPENVDKRRAEVGLGALADYAGRWDITWDVEKHKAMTKKLDAEKNNEMEKRN